MLDSRFRRKALLRGSILPLSIPWLDHGIQLKILKLLVFFIIFMDPVVKPRGDTVGFAGPHKCYELLAMTINKA